MDDCWYFHHLGRDIHSRILQDFFTDSLELNRAPEYLLDGIQGYSGHGGHQPRSKLMHQVGWADVLWGLVEISSRTPAVSSFTSCVASQAVTQCHVSVEMSDGELTPFPFLQWSRRVNLRPNSYEFVLPS